MTTENSCAFKNFGRKNIAAVTPPSSQDKPSGQLSSLSFRSALKKLISVLKILSAINMENSTVENSTGSKFRSYFIAHQTITMRVSSLSHMAKLFGRSEEALRQSVKYHFNYPWRLHQNQTK